MKKERNIAIDFFRGIVIINIVFIHTTFCSGLFYVPSYIRNLSLLIDVPIFFSWPGGLRAILKVLMEK